MKQAYVTVRRLLRYGLPILLCVAWLGFIFSNSMQNGVASGEQSKSVHQVVNEVAQSVGYDKPISEATVRTSAHFFEFGLLALLECWVLAAFGFLRMSRPLWHLPLCMATVLTDCVLMACVDETLQRFSQGRASEWKDVGIDTLGALLSLLLVSAALLAARLILLLRTKKDPTT